MFEYKKLLRASDVLTVAESFAKPKKKSLFGLAESLFVYLSNLDADVILGPTSMTFVKRLINYQ